MAPQNKYTTKLSGSRILIIGGTSGIGYAVAELLLQQNAHVIVSSSNASKVDAKVQTLQATYPDVKVGGIACDLAGRDTAEENIKRLLDEATKDGKLDHIIHTAGDAISEQHISNIDLDTVIQDGMVRFFALLLLFKHLPAYMNMATSPAPSVVITTGAGAHKPPPGFGVPVAYAAGIEGICRGMAVDLAPLRVVAVAPGFVETERWKDRGIDNDAMRGRFAERMLTARVGRVEDVAESYVYAVRDWNLTGVVLGTDGGQLLK